MGLSHCRSFLWLILLFWLHSESFRLPKSAWKSLNIGKSVDQSCNPHIISADPSYSKLHQSKFCLHMTLEANANIDVKIEAAEVYTDRSRVVVYCLSDIHADTERNQIWVEKNCVRQEADAYSVFIIPGDIGSEVVMIEKVLRKLAANYDCVCYVPGNHELWKRGTAKPSLEGDESSRMTEDSVQKLQEILEVAGKCGVHTGPVTINYAAHESKKRLVVLPLYSWYHASWDREPELTNELYVKVEEAIPFNRKWGDYSLCSWPEFLISHDEFTQNPPSNSTRLAEAFAALNEPHLTNIVQDNQSTSIISFSHFLPRQELCPEKRCLIEPGLMKVIGSDALERQIRQLKPTLHLFGHTHIPLDLEVDGIRYLQWPLGYYREADKQCAPVVNKGPLKVFDSLHGDEKQGIPPDLASLHLPWSRHYRTSAREPEEVENLAPWVIARLEKYSGFVYSREQREVAALESKAE